MSLNLIVICKTWVCSKILKNNGELKTNKSSIFSTVDKKQEMLSNHLVMWDILMDTLFF